MILYVLKVSIRRIFDQYFIILGLLSFGWIYLLNFLRFVLLDLKFDTNSFLFKKILIIFFIKTEIVLIIKINFKIKFDKIQNFNNKKIFF